MSQAVLLISDFGGTFTPPMFSQLNSGNISGTINISDPPDPGDITSRSFGCVFDIPAEVPFVDDLVTLTIIAGEAVVGIGAAAEGSLSVAHTLFGPIPLLSINPTATPFVGLLDCSVSVLASTLFASLGLSYPADSAAFFSDPLNPLLISGAIGAGATPPGAVTGSVGFSDFSFTVPDGAIAPPVPDIDVVGDGGIEVGNEDQYVGSGGLEIGEDPAFPAPLVVSADVTGMYTLVPGQHFDRVYTRNTDPAQTDDIAMPPPTGKTGYVGG